MVPKLNNKPTQSLKIIELQTLPPYVISFVLVHEIQLLYGRVMNDKTKSSVVIHEESEEGDIPNETMNETILKYGVIPKI